MSNTYIDPATDHVMVVDAPQDQSIDGISLPDNIRQQEMVIGSVAFVGPEVLRTRISDLVVYGPYAGKNIIVAGQEFRLLCEGQIEAYIRKSN